MTGYSARVFAVEIGPDRRPTGKQKALSRVSFSAPSKDAARSVLKAMLVGSKHKVISINQTGAQSLVAYVEMK